MKIAILAVLLLCLSLLVVGCAQDRSADNQKVSVEEMSDEAAVQEIDNSQIAEDSEVSIGDLV
jgi:ABC-type Fe3+-citrate transport system substrate-binding protein